MRNTHTLEGERMNMTHRYTTAPMTLFVVYFYVCSDEFKSAIRTTDEQQVSSFAAGLLQYTALILYSPETEYCLELCRLLR